MGSPEQIRRDLRSIIQQKPLESSASEVFFGEWCAINDDITPAFLTRGHWQTRINRLIEKSKDGSSMLYLSPDLQLWEMAPVIAAIDRDTFHDNTEEQTRRTEALTQLSEQLANAGIYIAQRLGTIGEGRQIAKVIAEEFYAYGTMLATGQGAQKECSAGSIAHFMLSQEDIQASEKLLSIKKGKKDALAQLFRVVQKAFTLEAQSDDSMLWDVGGEHIQPWETRTPMHTALLKKATKTVTALIETPASELKMAVFRRGMERLKNTMAKPETLSSFVLKTLLKERKTILLRDMLHIDEMKQLLLEARQSGNEFKIRNVEREIVTRIQEAVCAYTYEEDSNYPSKMVESNSVNCVGASMLAGALFSEVGITCLVGQMPGHSTIFIVRSDGGIEWRDMLSMSGNQTLTNAMVYGRKKDGSPVRVESIVAFSKHPTPQGLTFQMDLIRLPWVARGERRDVTVYGLEYGLELQVLNNIGADLLEAHRIPEAVEAFRQIVAQDPHYTYGYNGLGAALYKAGRDDEAIEAYQHAITLDPSYAVPYVGLGNCLVRLGRTLEALQAYRRFVLLADPKEQKDHIKAVREAIAEIEVDVRATAS